LAEQASPAAAIVSVPSPSVQSGWQVLPACVEWRNQTARNSPREDEMLAAMSIGFMLVIWVIVLWGSSYFNNNIH
jgi:hypothetical protein